MDDSTRSQQTTQSTGYVVLWRSIRKHWSTALATALAVSLVVTFYTLGQTKIYQASATVQFDPNPPRPLGKDVDMGLDMGAGNYWDNREYYETQYKIIQSMRVATAVAHDLQLGRDLMFIKNRPGTAIAQQSLPDDEAAEVLLSRLTVTPIKDSRLAYAKFDDADPARAQRILTTLVDTYIEQNLESALSSTNSALEWLRRQLDTLKVDLESSEMALHEYKLSKNILSVDIDAQSNMLREEMKQLNDTLTAVRTKREELSARRNELLKVQPDNAQNLPASELLQSQLLQALRQRYQDSLRERDSLVGEGKGISHPEVKGAEARVNTSRDALLAEVRNIQGAVERDLAVANHEESGLSGLFDKAKKQALDLNLLEIEYNRLKRSKENNEKMFGLVLERTKENDLARMLRVNNIRVVDRPLLPRVPIRPRVLINIVVGTFFGLVLGALAAVAKVLLDRTVKTPDDVEHNLGLTFLGLLPSISEGNRGGYYYARRRRRPSPSITNRELVVHEHPTSGIAEAARAIRTNLIFMAPDNPHRTILITSAGPAEGKTTVACCIAIAMAQAGQRVVLVDCDLRRPRIHRVFHKSSEYGVTTSLLKADGLDEAIQATEVNGLSVIPAGPLPPNPAELLHSDRFKTLLGALADRFDRVIIDSPPAAAVTDPAILSTLVDGSVLVVRAFATNKELARQGARALIDVGGKVAGVVLNAVDLDRSEYRYYHYYYKKDGYYAQVPASPMGVEPPPPPN
jgi:capsular exopolysaccharide synthesis family protein